MPLAATFLALVLTLAPQAPVPAPVRCAATDLLLNELLPGPARDWNGDGAYSSRDDEWLEILNPGAEALDLGAYLVTDADRLPRYAFSGTLAAGARRLVTGRDSYDWERAGGFPAFGLSLGNSGDTVMLWKVAGAETLLVDSYTYSSHEAAADRALGRLPDGGGWALLDGLNPYVGTQLPQGTGCPPTPGEPNLCDDTPVRPGTWGQLKSLYR
jgi:hypothetical protein